MFANAFDLVLADVEASYPGHFSQAYADIGKTLRRFGSRRIRGNVYPYDREDLANRTSATDASKALTWFASCVRHIRAFRVEKWSDLTAFMKDPAG